MYKAGVVQNPEATNPAYHETEGATLGLTALTRYYNNPPAPDAAIASPGGYGGLGFSKRTPKDEAAFASAFGAENVARLRELVLEHGHFPGWMQPPNAPERCVVHSFSHSQ